MPARRSCLWDRLVTLIWIQGSFGIETLGECVMSVVGSGIESGRRTLVLVIGMHRSGTSTVAGALGILGATMPVTGLGLSDDNPKGHFEPKEIVALHDRILASVGMHWWGWDKVPDAWYDTPNAQSFVDELVKIIRAEFGAAPLFVVKDPRTCKLLPLWRRATAILDLDVVAVLPFRHPDEVARSLHARDRFPLPNTLMAWLRYVLEAERESRDLRRVFLRYEDLLSDGRAVMQRVVESLRLNLPRQSENDLRELDAFIDPGLRRSRAASANIDQLHPWLRETMIAYARGADGTGKGLDPSILDQIHAEFDKACGAFIPALDATNRGFEEAQRRNILIPGLVEERDAALSEAATQRGVAEEQTIAAQNAIDEAAQLRARLRTLESRIEALEAQSEQPQASEPEPRRWWQRG